MPPPRRHAGQRDDGGARVAPPPSSPANYPGDGSANGGDYPRRHHRRRASAAAARRSSLALSLALVVLLNAAVGPSLAAAASAPARRLQQQPEPPLSLATAPNNKQRQAKPALSLSGQQRQQQQPQAAPPPTAAAAAPTPVAAGKVAQCTFWSAAPPAPATATALPPFETPPPTCAVSPAYASLALERYDEEETSSADSDPAAALLARALRCAASGSAAACASSPDLCAWREADRRCALRADALLAVQQRCARPRYQRALAKLQQCMARGAGAQRCQCRTPAECASAAAAAGAAAAPGGSDGDEGCRSLLGCWLTAALGSRADVTRLVQAAALQVLPQLDAVAAVAAVGSSGGDGELTAAAAAGADTNAGTPAPDLGSRRRRRQLLQTSLSMGGDAGAAPSPSGPPSPRQQHRAASGLGSAAGLRRAAPDSAVGQNRPFTDVTGARRPPSTLAPIDSSAYVGGDAGGAGGPGGEAVGSAPADRAPAPDGQALLAAALNGGSGAAGNSNAAEGPSEGMRDPLSAEGGGFVHESGRLVQESGSYAGPASQAIVPLLDRPSADPALASAGTFLPPLPQDADVGAGGTAPAAFWTCVGMPAPASPAAAAAAAAPAAGSDGGDNAASTTAPSPAEALARFILADDAESGGPAAATATAASTITSGSGPAALLAALGRGAKALSCLEQQQGGTGPAAAAERPAEQAAAQLARAFSVAQERYAAYFDNTPQGEARPAAAQAALRAVVDSALPDPLSKLQQRGDAAAAAAAATAATAAGAAAAGGQAAGVDVLLRAQALVADLMWATREARFLLPPEQGQQQQQGQAASAAVAAAGSGPSAADAVMLAAARYVATMARHASAWLYRERFGGGRAAELPPRPSATPAGAAGEAALAGLAGAYLPALGVSPAVDAGWQQVRAMSGRAMHAATSPAWLAAVAGDGAAADGSSPSSSSPQQQGAVVALAAAADGLGAAHVADFWGRRFDSLRASAPPAARSLALADRSTEPSWAALVGGQADAVAGLVALASGAGGGGTAGGDAAAAAVAARQAAVASGLRRLVAAVPENQLPREVPQGGLDAQLLASAVDIATSAARCYGGRGGDPASAAARAQQQQDAAACAALQDATDVVLLRALGLDRSDPLYPQLRSDLGTQWRCTGRGGAVADCTADPACAVTVVPASSALATATGAASSPSSNSTIQVCEAARVALSMGSTDAARAAVAVSPACASVLAVPACDAPPLSASAAACRASAPHCQWVEGDAPGDVAGRAFFSHGEVGPSAAFGGVGGVGAVSGGAGVASKAAAAKKANATATAAVGACVADWSPLVALLEPPAAQQLDAARSQCAERSASGGIEACSALQADASTLGRRRRAEGAAASLRLWLPALVVVLVLLLCGAAVGGWWLWRARARRLAAAKYGMGGPDGGGAAAGAEASAASRLRSGRGHHASGSPRNGNGGGKKKGAGWLKKPSRPAPGTRRDMPDLMRDSFTDYMQAQPRKFGVEEDEPSSTDNPAAALALAAAADGVAFSSSDGDGALFVVGARLPAIAAGNGAGPSGYGGVGVDYYNAESVRGGGGAAGGAGAGNSTAGGSGASTNPLLLAPEPSLGFILGASATSGTNNPLHRPPVPAGRTASLPLRAANVAAHAARVGGNEDCGAGPGSAFHDSVRTFRPAPGAATTATAAATSTRGGVASTAGGGMAAPSVREEEEQ